jgi:hypothetical protein
MSVMVTLILRKALIYFLIFISPISFAAFVLPNTEKLFKMWWNYLYKALLVYVVIEVIFAMSKVMAVTLNLPMDNGGITGALNALASIIVMVMPLFLIPFAFKLAGGAMGSLYGTLSGLGKKATEGIKGQANDPNSLRNTTRRRAANNMIKNRAQFVRRRAENPDYSRFGRRLGKMANFGNVMDKEAAINEDAQKRMGRTSGSGDDTYIRARTSLALYQKKGGGETTDASEAVTKGGRAQRVMKDGQAMRTSMNGQKRYTDYAYNKSKSLYRDQGELQEAFNYEAKKSLTNGDTDTLLKNYGSWAKQEGFTTEQAGGVFTGVAFARQGERLELKHSKVEEDGQGGFRVVGAANNTGATKIDGTTGDVQQIGGRDSFVQELYDKKGSWAVSQMHDSTINEIGEAKEGYAKEVRALSAKQAATGPLSPEEQTRLSLSQQKLGQIQEMEDTWVADPSRGGNAVTDGEGTPSYSGLSGAAQGVQAAAKNMAIRSGGTVTDSSGASHTVDVRKRYDKRGIQTKETARVLNKTSGKYEEFSV